MEASIGLCTTEYDCRVETARWKLRVGLGEAPRYMASHACVSTERETCQFTEVGLCTFSEALEQYGSVEAMNNNTQRKAQLPRHRYLPVSCVSGALFLQCTCV